MFQCEFDAIPQLDTPLHTQKPLQIVLNLFIDINKIY